MHLNRKSLKPLFQTPSPIILPEPYRKNTRVSQCTGAPPCKEESAVQQTSGLLTAITPNASCEILHLFSQCPTYAVAHGQKWFVCFHCPKIFNNFIF